MDLVYFWGSMDIGKGAQRNAKTMMSGNIFLLVGERGDTSSKGFTSALLMLNTSTNIAMIKYPVPARMAMLA